ncbi:hypothetical protein QTP88_007657 [Uroleucon formosanum]
MGSGGGYSFCGCESAYNGVPPVSYLLTRPSSLPRLDNQIKMFEKIHFEQDTYENTAVTDRGYCASSLQSSSPFKFIVRYVHFPRRLFCQRKDQSQRNDNKSSEWRRRKESCSNDGLHELYTLLNSMSATLDQLAENCCSVNDRINLLEMECIDLLQPIGDIISLERELKRLSEVETNYMKLLKNHENNINLQEPI